MRRQKTTAIAALCAAWLIGCTANDAPAPVSVAQAESAISGGMPDTTSTAVVGISQLAANGLCTGSLIAPNVVLTARHCVSPTTSGGSSVICGETGFTGLYEPSTFLVTTASMVTPEDAGELFVSEVVTLPEQSGNVPDFCGNDVAILILSETIDDVTPLEPRLDDAPAMSGELFSAVGYGAVNGAGDDSGTRRRLDGIGVDCVSTECENHPAFGDTVRANEWVGEGGVCQGDSGGPALDDQNRVFGVTSRGEADCGATIYGYTVSRTQWLQDVTVYASGIGLYQAPAWTAGSTVNPEHSMPIGDACSSDDDCPSGKCVNQDGNRFCSRACTSEHPCPLDYECVADPTYGSVCMVDSDTPNVPVTGGSPPERGGGCALTSEPVQSGDVAWLVCLAWAGVAFGLRRRNER